MQNWLFIIFSFFLLPLISIGQSCPADASILEYTFCGNALDISGNNYHGQPLSPTLTTDRFGNPDKAYDFNGTSDYILVGDEPDLGTNDFSIEVWFYPRNIPPSPGARLVSKGASIFGTPSNAGFTIKVRNIGGSNELRFSVGGSSGTLVTATYTSIPLNQWVHVVAIREGTEIRLFVNGQPESTLSSGNTFNLDTNLPFTLGRLDRGGFGPNVEYFDGIIDLVRIYDYPLSEDEVKCLFELDSDDLPPSPIPTMSQWALLLFGLMIMGVCLVGIFNFKLLAN
jgi:hypothetical protein